jgi:hypothetical protein
MRSVLASPRPGGYAQVQPSPSPTGPIGRRLGGGAGRRLVPQGAAFHRWVLLAIELVLTGALRHWSRNHHGG